MTSKEERLLDRGRPIAIVRLEDLKEAVNISRALLAGGITALEFTLTNRQAFVAIEEVRGTLNGKVRVGAGTVLNAEDAHTAIQCGAEFLVTPTYQPDVIAVGQSTNTLVVCGAFTPTEIWTAWQRGAGLVKVFPARAVGPSYIKDVLAPLPELRLVPTGGVNVENCAAFLSAGAYTVALGSNLVNEQLIQRKDWAALETLARRFVEACTKQQEQATHAQTNREKG